MKSFKSLSILAIFFISAFVLTSGKCSKTCVGPAIVFDPSATTMTAAPGESFTVTISVTGENDNIESVVVSKSSNGATNPSFISITGIGAKGKSVTLTDSVPATGIPFGSIITYTVVATSDCKDAVSETKTLTITVGPSSKPLDAFLYFVKNTTAPRVYNRWSLVPTNPSAWDIMGRIAKFAGDPNIDKDIRDSSTGTAPGSPFIGNTRWGSRNGSKFVKAASNFDYNAPSAKSIVDAYNTGAQLDLMTYSVNDVLIINIKNTGKYAAIKIESIMDVSPGSPESYTYFSYWQAQL